MPTVTESVLIAKDANSLWRDIGAFGAWHPMLPSVDAEGEQRGALRTVHGKDGSLQAERLLEMAPRGHAYRYEMVATGMPVTN